MKFIQPPTKNRTNPMTQNAPQPIWPDTFDDSNALKDIALEQKVDAEIERVEKMICHPQVKQDKEKQNGIYTQDLPLFGA